METQRILFVDDEPGITAALTRVFRDEPYEIFSANSADEALTILEHREIDVIVSEERMDKMSGSEFLGIVRVKYPLTIRMILTGQPSLEALRAVDEGEIYRFFTKPCNEIDVIATVRQALREKELASDSRWLLRQVRQQTRILRELERRISYPAKQGAPMTEDVEELFERIAEQIRQRIAAGR